MNSIRERLEEAADYLDDLATHAPHANDASGAGVWRVDVAGPVASTQWLGPSHDALTATWPQAAMVEAFSPEFARLLAMWMRTEAKGNFGDEDHTTCVVERCESMAALALADHLLEHKHRAVPVEEGDRRGD